MAWAPDGSSLFAWAALETLRVWQIREHEAQLVRLPGSLQRDTWGLAVVPSNSTQ